MRRLWPPTYDKFSMRSWAAICSLFLNSLFALMAPVVPSVALWFFIPGLIPIVMATGGWFTSLALLGSVIMLLTNFAFYYFMVLWIIAACRPATNWWPKT